MEIIPWVWIFSGILWLLHSMSAMPVPEIIGYPPTSPDTGLTSGLTLTLSMGHTPGIATDLTTGHTPGIATYLTTGHTPGIATELTTGHTPGIATELTTGHTPGIATDLTTGHTPGIATDLTTGHTPGIATDLTTGHTPGIATDLTTGHTPGIATDLTTGHTPGIATDLTTGHAPGLATELTTGHTPGIATDLTTGHTPGIATDLTTGHAPGIATDLTTGHAPGIATDLTTGHTPGIATDLTTGHAPGIATGHSMVQATTDAAEDLQAMQKGNAGLMAAGGEAESNSNYTLHLACEFIGAESRFTFSWMKIGISREPQILPNSTSSILEVKREATTLTGYKCDTFYNHQKITSINYLVYSEADIEIRKGKRRAVQIGMLVIIAAFMVIYNILFAVLFLAFSCKNNPSTCNKLKAAEEGRLGVSTQPAGAVGPDEGTEQNPSEPEPSRKVNSPTPR